MHVQRLTLRAFILGWVVVYSVDSASSSRQHHVPEIAAETDDVVLERYRWKCINNLLAMVLIGRNHYTPPIFMHFKNRSRTCCTYFTSHTTHVSRSDSSPNLFVNPSVRKFLVQRAVLQQLKDADLTHSEMHDGFYNLYILP